MCALTTAFLNGFLSNFVQRCIFVNSTHLLFLVMLPPVFRLYRVKGNILVGYLVCALQATFLDRFLFTFCTDVHHSQIYTPICFGDAAPSVPSVIGVKGHILVHILMCTLTAAFLDGFLSNFVWRCILVKSTCLLFLMMLPPVFRLL